MIDRILDHFGYVKKQPYTEISDAELLSKARTLIGQKANISGCCGDVEMIKLTSVVDISNGYGYREVRFTTDDTYYSTVLFKAETVMNWKYN